MTNGIAWRSRSAPVTSPRCVWLTQSIASSSRRSNSARLSLKRWSEALTTHSRFGSLARVEDALRPPRAERTHRWVEWIAASGVGLHAVDDRRALKVGSFGTP